MLMYSTVPSVLESECPFFPAIIKLSRKVGITSQLHVGSQLVARFEFRATSLYVKINRGQRVRS